MFGAIAGGIASALAGGAMSKLFGGGQKAASGGIQGDVLARSEERRVGKECRAGWLLGHKKKNMSPGLYLNSSAPLTVVIVMKNEMVRYVMKCSSTESMDPV